MTSLKKSAGRVTAIGAFLDGARRLGSSRDAGACRTYGWGV
jgi:hypothetical protein